MNILEIVQESNFGKATSEEHGLMQEATTVEIQMFDEREPTSINESIKGKYIPHSILVDLEQTECTRHIL
jgi:hypothetical protein